MTTLPLSDTERAVDCLNRLARWRVDDRDAWLKVGMALHSVSGELFTAWDEWSRQSEKYRAADARAVWRSFKADDGISLGSLIRWANEDDPGNAPNPPPPRTAARPKAASSNNGNGKPARIYPTPEAAVQVLEQQTGGTYAAHWSYHHADGSEVLRVVRLHVPSGASGKAKTYRPLHPVDGGWAFGDPAGPLPLYNLPAILQADRVAVVEGEKCADMAIGLGLTATTSAHGAQAPHKTDWTPLAGRDVTIYPDCGSDGSKYAATVAGILESLGPPARVRIVDLPGLQEGKDLAEWLEPRDSQEPEQIVAALEALPARATATNGTASGEPDSGCTPILTCMADVVAKPVEWLWPGKIPLGCLTLVVGRPGEGKSYLSCDAAARVSMGTPWPDGSECPRGSTILISAEDDPATVLRPRLDAHYANVRRIHLLSAVRRADPSGKGLEVLFTLQDLDALEAALRQLSDVRLIVIDPIGSFLGARTDAHRDNEVRAVLAPVAQLAAKYGAAALVIAHRRKATGATADELAIGSRAFTGIARAVWHVSRDGQSERRLFLPGKSNVAKRANGAAFAIVGEPVGRVSWERDPVSMTADQALSVEAEQGGGQGVRESCKEWLRELLASGPLSAATIKAEAKAAGFTAATLRRAREEMPIRVYKLPGQMGGPWHWRLKGEGAHQAGSDPIPETAPAEDAQEGAHHV